VTQKVENILSAEKRFRLLLLLSPILFNDGDDIVVFHDNPLDVLLMSFPPTN